MYGGMSGSPYRSLHIAVMIRATRVNTEAHTHRQLWTGYTISSAS